MDLEITIQATMPSETAVVSAVDRATCPATEAVIAALATLQAAGITISSAVLGSGYFMGGAVDLTPPS